MGRLVPIVHAVQHCILLVHHQGRRFGDGVQLGIRHHQRDFDDSVGVREQTGHFHVNPDEIIIVRLLCHNVFLNFLK